ncbi:MAG: adenylate kinase [Oscillospiraceae bacterium]|nr:adenylate kinase [Oscillospiraceae bacterium]
MKLILLGAPGVGKGTQADILTRELHIPAISTGNMLRAAMKDHTPLGEKVREYMDTGKLVSDEIVIELLSNRIQDPDCANGFILDGVPRTIGQAEALEQAGISFDAAVVLENSDDVIIERIGGRRVCEVCGASYHLKHSPAKVDGVCDKCGGKLVQRKDDAPETVKNRLEVYHSTTEPLKGFYETRGILKTVYDQPTIAETTRELMAVLGEIR